MPHISNKKISEDSLNKIFFQLTRLINTVGSERKSEVLFKEFFTDTEKIMFAKRLAIIFMLEEGISRPYISEVLCVSPSTLDKAYLNFENGKYKYIQNIIKKNNRSIFEVVENLIRENTSTYLGRRRLAWMDKLEDKYQKKIFSI